MDSTQSKINQKIITIQNELKAPKGQYNSFAKFRYRSQEDILEALKPLLAKYGVLQTITDDIVQLGDRYYIKATVTVLDSEGGDFITNYISVSAFAREPLSKKGMDDPQITGTASSYARKYALNGMWLIDDTKDADTDEYNKSKPELRPLRESDPAFDKIVYRLSKGKATLADVQKHYSVDDEMIAKINDAVNNLSKTKEG